MLGVSLTITGTRDASTTQRVTLLDQLGILTDRRTHSAFGHPVRTAEIQLEPVDGTACTALTRSCQALLRCISVISEATIARSGYAALHSAISRRLSSSGRSVMSSMLDAGALAQLVGRANPGTAGAHRIRHHDRARAADQIAGGDAPDKARNVNRGWARACAGRVVAVQTAVRFDPDVERRHRFGQRRSKDARENVR